MNKKISFLVLSGALLLSPVVSAQLQYYAPGAPPVGSLWNIVNNIEYAAGLIFGAIAVICFVIAGVMFLTAQGMPEKLQAARSAVMWGIAGVIVGIVAFSIIAIVANFIA